MTAEVAISIIEALSPSERKRLFSAPQIKQMIDGDQKPVKSRKTPKMTDSQALKYLFGLYLKKPQVRI